MGFFSYFDAVSGPPSRPDLPSAAWSAHGAEMTEACLGAMQVTKVARGDF